MLSGDIRARVTNILAGTEVMIDSAGLVRSAALYSPCASI